MKNKFLANFIFLVFLGFSLQGNAGLLDLQFNGYVGSIGSNDSSFSPTYSIGDNVSGTINFASDIPYDWSGFPYDWSGFDDLYNTD
jgi:hypothetical protein